MRLKTVAMAVVAASVLAAGVAFADMEGLQEHTAQGNIVDWKTGTVFIKSEGLPKDGVTSMAKKRWTAKEAANLYAMRNLALMVVGLELEGDMAAEDGALVSSKVAGAFRASVKAGAIYDSDNPKLTALGLTGLGWNAQDESYTIVMEANLFGVHSVSSAVCASHTQALLSQLHGADPTTKPQFQDVPPPDTKDLPADGTTGLIVDCTGVDVEAGLSPKIFNGEQAVYGSGPIDTNTAITKGIVGYAASMDEAKGLKDRVGANPMVITATGVKGTHSVTISADDAAKIAEANKTGKFLDRLAVIFVCKEK